MVSIKKRNSNNTNLIEERVWANQSQMMKVEYQRKKEWYADGSRAEWNQQNKIQKHRDQIFTAHNLSEKWTDWKAVCPELWNSQFGYKYNSVVKNVGTES